MLHLGKKYKIIYADPPWRYVFSETKTRSIEHHYQTLSLKGIKDLKIFCKDKKYQVIYADPPWRFKNWSMEELAERGEKWARRNGRSPYGVIDTEEICRMGVGDIADKDCVLFLWATYPKMQDAFSVIDAWGFMYKTVAFTWVKTRNNGSFHFGLGYWTRGNCEICLLATKGHPHRVSKSVPNLVVSKLRDHSRKPDEVRNRIVELCGDVPRIELFARNRFEKWDCFGDQLSSTVQKVLV